jgi:hypothetical protein
MDAQVEPASVGMLFGLQGTAIAAANPASSAALRVDPAAKSVVKVEPFQSAESSPATLSPDYRSARTGSFGAALLSAVAALPPPTIVNDKAPAHTPVSQEPNVPVAALSYLNALTLEVRYSFDYHFFFILFNM